MIVIFLYYIMIEGRRVNIAKRKEKYKCILLKVQRECKLFLPFFPNSVEDSLQMNPSSWPLQPCESLWSWQLPNF